MVVLLEQPSLSGSINLLMTFLVTFLLVSYFFPFILFSIFFFYFVLKSFCLACFIICIRLFFTWLISLTYLLSDLHLSHFLYCLFTFYPSSFFIYFSLYFSFNHSFLIAVSSFVFSFRLYIFLSFTSFNTFCSDLLPIFTSSLMSSLYSYNLLFLIFFRLFLPLFTLNTLYLLVKAPVYYLRPSIFSFFSHPFDFSHTYYLLRLSFNSSTHFLF